MSQADVARVAGVSRATLSRWESGSGAPSRRHLDALSTALQTTASALYASAETPATLNSALLGATIECLEGALGTSFSLLTASQRARLMGFVYAKGGHITGPEAQALIGLLR